MTPPWMVPNYEQGAPSGSFLFPCTAFLEDSDSPFHSHA
ncbi:MAG: hypothetical protein QOF53_273 [Nocardioidaceae bacterium]|jgi:hypothetical protein|nr:hypothetical protein [Nocardioidaceae bacterium]